MPSTPAMSNKPSALLSIDGLAIRSRDGAALVHDLSLTLTGGEWLTLVGESGSGKSLTALSCLDLLPRSLHADGDIRWQGQLLREMNATRRQRLRGGDIGMVFQEPLTALNPLHRIGRQLVEAIQLHQPVSHALAERQAVQLLREVGISDPQRRLRAWPHELSGGQRQRVVIAMALANQPRLLIADEPTTALDAILQIQILDLIKTLQKRRGLAVLHISHDLPQVRRYADRVMVLRAGTVVESGATAEVFEHPCHDYTRTLLAPFATTPPDSASEGQPLLTVSRLDVRFPRKTTWWGRVSEWQDAVSQVGLTLRAGEALGIVGESGSGKSSLANALMRLTQASGSVRFRDLDWLSLQGEPLRQQRKHLQMVFQDPYSSFSPRLTVADIIAEGLLAHQHGMTAAERDAAVVAALNEVQIDASARHRYPHEFSGGQRQRIALARALILKPSLLVLDEPTSALDRRTQGDIIALLNQIRARSGLSYLLISHDLDVIRAVCQRVLVLHKGRIVEQAATAQLFARPQHAYTRALLSARRD